MLLIPVKSNIEPTASSIVYTRGYLFIASTVHDSFLVRLSGIEHLPSVNQFETPVDDIQITQGKRRKQTKERTLELIAEKVDAVLNLHATNSVIDSDERVMYACSGYGRYNYISKLALSHVPDVIFELELENFTSPTYVYCDAKILVISNATATTAFTLGENIAVNKTLKIERKSRTLLIGKMGACLYQVLPNGI